MDVLEIFKDLVSNLGVPIACLAVTFRLWNKEREDHKESEKTMTEAINNNTMALNRLAEKMERE